MQNPEDRMLSSQELGASCRYIVCTYQTSMVLRHEESMESSEGKLHVIDLFEIAVTPVAPGCTPSACLVASAGYVEAKMHHDFANGCERIHRVSQHAQHRRGKIY